MSHSAESFGNLPHSSEHNLLLLSDAALCLLDFSVLVNSAHGLRMTRSSAIASQETLDIV